jgi:hypothetical protein
MVSMLLSLDFFIMFKKMATPLTSSNFLESFACGQTLTTPKALYPKQRGLTQIT